MKRAVTLTLVLALQVAGLHGSADARPSVLGGGHDFDFLLGTWHTHISYLRASDPRSSQWINLDGAVVNRTIWNGAGDLEEIEASGAGTHFEGMTLRLYNVRAHQWNLYWANSSDGRLESPMSGDFSGGVGTFYDQETVDGRAAFVRQRYFSAGRNSYRFEQAVSTDGGTTWTTNFRAALTRTATTAAPEIEAVDSATPAAQHDFDWQFGMWRIRMSRLLHPFSGSNERGELDGTVAVQRIWKGRANFAKIDAQGKSGSVHILALRLYLPQSGQWSLSFTTEGDGSLSVPMYGSFKNGRGEFYDQEFFHDKAILDKFVFYGGANSARDEESFSADGGKTWEVIWLNTHSRSLDMTRAPVHSP
jgi:hypothetical protein